MNTSSLPNDFEIAPGYGAKDWKGLTLDDQDPSSADWATAISILDGRIRGRFIVPAQFLIDSESGSGRGTNGFAVLAIDFLLIETIQGFFEGLISHKRKSATIFNGFLATWPAFMACVPQAQDADEQAKINHELANRVFEQAGCALHHTGSTDRIIVRKSGDRMFVFHDNGRIEIDRSLLHQKLTNSFDDYLGSLKHPANADLRKKFRQKMNHICL